MTNLSKITLWMQRYILAASLLALVACSGGMDEQQKLQSAKAYIDKGDLATASIELRNTLQANAENAEARFLLGSISMQIGDLASAEKEFRRAAKAGWNIEETQIELARVLLAQREPRKLLDEINVSDTWSKSTKANLLGLRALAEASLGDISNAKTTLAEGTKYNQAAFHIFKSTATLQLANIISGDARETLKQGLAIFKDNPELLLLSTTTRLQVNDLAAAAEIYRNIINQDTTTLISSNGRKARIGLARLYIIERNLEQAQITLKPLYKRNDNDPEANFFGGLLAFEQGNYILAEEHIRKILKLAPDHHLSQQLMGKIKLRLEDYDQAVHYLSSYLKGAPGDLAVRKLLTSTYITLNQPHLARSTLQPVLLKDPDDVGSLLLLSKLEHSEGNTKASINTLQKVVNIDPQNAAIRKQLAIAYISAGETQAALKELQVYREISKNTQDANKLIIAVYLKSNQYKQAIKVANDMLKDDPENPAVLSLNGSVYAASGDQALGRNYFEKAIQLNKNLLSASLGLAEIEHKEGNIEKATELYQSLINSGTGGTAPILALAALSEQQGLKDEMLRWLEKARETAPGALKPRIILANYYLNNRQPEKADLIVQEALKISPLNTDTLALQGRTLMAQQRYNEALPPLNKLINNKPESAYARALLGETYARLGMSKDAREHLHKALEIKPDLPPALVLMAEIELKNGKSDLSMSYAKRLQKILPDLNLGYKLEGDVWMSKQNFVKANIALNKAWKRQQTAATAISMFKASTQTSDINTALKPIIKWLNDNPDDIATRFFLASAYQNRNLNEDAVREYERILEKAPGNATVLNNLAWLYSISGDARAKDMAEKAYKAAPENPGIQDTYGWILLQQNQLDEGRRLLKRALEQSPLTEEIRYHYAVALMKSGNTKEGGEILRKLLDEGKPFRGRDEANRLMIEYNAKK